MIEGARPDKEKETIDPYSERREDKEPIEEGETIDPYNEKDEDKGKSWFRRRRSMPSPSKDKEEKS